MSSFILMTIVLTPVSACPSGQVSKLKMNLSGSKIYSSQTSIRILSLVVDPGFAIWRERRLPHREGTGLMLFWPLPSNLHKTEENQNPRGCLCPPPALESATCLRISEFELSFATVLSVLGWHFIMRQMCHVCLGECTQCFSSFLNSTRILRDNKSLFLVISYLVIKCILWLRSVPF